MYFLFFFPDSFQAAELVMETFSKVPKDDKRRWVKTKVDNSVLFPSEKAVDMFVTGRSS